MTIRSGNLSEVGFVKPMDVKPVPVAVSQPIATQQQQQTKNWLDKIGEYGSKLLTGLYTGAMAGLDIYERYKMIEKGQPTTTWSEVAKTGTGQVVVLGQSFDKNMLYILLGAVILIVVLAILMKK